MLGYKVNIDYEYKLFDIAANTHRINKELEYLYLLLGDTDKSLISEVKYDQEYLNYLNDLGFPEISISAQGKSENWWGALSDVEKEKSLNSKLTSLKIATDLGLHHQAATFVSSREELEQHISKYDYESWVLKEPFLFSGKGFHHIKKKSLENITFTGIMLLEPWLERVLDIGTLVQGETFSHHFNFVNERGGYIGSLCSRDKNFLKILEDHSHDFRRIISSYMKIGAKEGFSIDSFYYHEDSQLKFLPLVEINYRKSLGWVTQKLREFYNDNYGAFVLIPRKKSPVDIPQNIVRLSPSFTFFETFYVRANNLDEMRSLLEKVDLDFSISTKKLIDLQGSI